MTNDQTSQRHADDPGWRDIPDWGEVIPLDDAARREAQHLGIERPVITIKAGELHTLATEAEDALIATGAPIYRRGGMLAKPVVDDVAAAHGRRTKVARLIPVTAPMLIDHLSRSADWRKFDGRKKGFIATDPPANVAATLLARDGEWRLSPIVGAITAPTLRPDGTILATPGYDPQTRLFLLDPPTMPEIPDAPTRQDAMASLACLDALLVGFPFVKADGDADAMSASRSVALSALITPIVRGAMPVAPLHATTAPVAGSGKSYLFDLASAIATGDRAPVISAGGHEVETEKRLASALLDGMAIVSIDNVNGQLGGDALCQYIERPLVAVRPLGMSKIIRIESRATLFATGNNIQIVGDMTRRTLLCSLDPNMERPELRTFETRPFDQVMADRGKYIAAALTVVRAYLQAGCPAIRPALASFEEWSRLVRSALVWLGRADPVDTMDAARADDPVLTTLSAVLQAWRDEAGDGARTTGGMIDAATVRNPVNGAREKPTLFEALFEVADNKRGDIDPVRLGKFLGKNKGRIVGNLRLVPGSDSHAKVATWKVVMNDQSCGR